jgi:hypothetical protein
MITREYIELGPVPCNEDCQQVGLPTYDPQLARKECQRYKAQLEKQFPGAVFGIKNFPHDFGQYNEVVVYYTLQNEAETDLAYEIEGSLPLNWAK